MNSNDALLVYPSADAVNPQVHLMQRHPCARSTKSSFAVTYTKSPTRDSLDSLGVGHQGPTIGSPPTYRGRYKHRRNEGSGCRPFPSIILWQRRGCTCGRVEGIQMLAGWATGKTPGIQAVETGVRQNILR